MSIPFPKSYNSNNVDKALTENDKSFILKKCLLPQHATDPNVLGFIQAYLMCRDAKQAAREVGLNSRDGEILKRRSDIHEAIRQLTEKAVLKYGYDATEVVERVKEIAMIDPIDLENLDGSFKKHMKDLSPELRRSIKKMRVKNIFENDPNGMKVITGEIIEIEFHDKMKAVELLGREKDIFKETKKVTHDLTDNMSSVLLQSRDRAAEHIKQLREVSDKPSLTHSNVIDVTVEEDAS